MQIHLCADDTQLYLPFQSDQSEEVMKRLNACVEDIKQWMENNFLLLNDTKAEFIIFGTPKNVGKVVEWTVDVGDAIIILSGSVRNIGAMLNPTFNMETHIISMKESLLPPTPLAVQDSKIPDPGLCRETNPCLCNV